MTRIVALDHVAELVKRFRDARYAASRMKAEADAAEAELMAELGDADIGTVGGRPAVQRSVKARPQFDTTAFRVAHPDLFAQFSHRQQCHKDRLIIPRPRSSPDGGS